MHRKVHPGVERQAKENLQEAQAAQKRWYNQQARLCQFQPGQKVLLLLPPSTNKLLAKWQGPYTVVRKMGPVTYEICHPDKRKTHQTCHINLLKEWKEGTVTPKNMALMVRTVGDEPAPDMRPHRDAAMVMLDHLDGPQRTELKDLLHQLPSLFWPRPGWTDLIQHTIHLTNPTPSRQQPNRIPE